MLGNVSMLLFNWHARTFEQRRTPGGLLVMFYAFCWGDYVRKHFFVFQINRRF